MDWACVATRLCKPRFYRRAFLVIFRLDIRRGVLRRHHGFRRAVCFDDRVKAVH